MTFRSLSVSAVILLGFACGAFLVSPGFFTIDEFILYIGAQAVRDGSFAVSNGTDLFTSGQLRLWLLVDGPQGLTPQYPPGSAVVGAPLLAFFGPAGMILVNALAAAGLVIGTFRLTRDHFGGRDSAIAAVFLLVFASFLLEYAFAVWPHTVGALSILIAFILLLDSLKEEGPSLWRAGAMGAALGLGIAFRADVAIAVPALGAALFLYRDKPFASLLAFAAGLIPFLLALAWINSVKFGVFSPITYGQPNGGGTSFTTHLPLLIAASVGAAFAFPAKWAWSRTSHKRPVILAILGITLVAAIVVHDLVGRYLHGFWALVIDATAITEERTGVERLPDGTVAFWGFWKKALAQSMPWLGLVPLAFLLKGTPSRSVKGAALILFFMWSLPFFPRAWHGGMGSNMRYFLPLLPLFCAFAGAALAIMWSKVGEARTKAGIGLVSGCAAVLLWIALHPSSEAGAHQFLPTWIALILLPLLAYAWFRGFEAERTTSLALIASFLAIGVAAQMTLRDFEAGQENRQRAASLSAAHQSLPDKALVYAPSRFLVGWALEPTHISALPHPNNGILDQRLIQQALDKGWRVLVWHTYVTEDLLQNTEFRVVRSDQGSAFHAFYEVRPTQDRMTAQ